MGKGKESKKHDNPQQRNNFMYNIKVNLLEISLEQTSLKDISKQSAPKILWIYSYTGIYFSLEQAEKWVCSLLFKSLSVTMGASYRGNQLTAEFVHYHGFNTGAIQDQ